jgi:DNA-binding NarL/FixJ family response regulator
MRPRVLITHEHRLFVSGLELLLAPEFDVVLATTDFGDTVSAAIDFQPDLLLLGLSKDPKIGLQIISDVRTLVPATKVGVVSRWNDGALAADAFRRGALAYILKTSTEDEFLAGVHAVLEDRMYVSPDLAGSTIESFVAVEKREPGLLTERQIAIVKLLATGMSMKEVAVAMNLTPRTVAFHKYAAMRRINVTTSAELVRFAVTNGLA